ncbi:hypothetical protein BaRGS_00024977 [Batillaria attramentaria]|uniref:Uncharacterized protein n=1 Tax=Batillaria attramentaria TaxID=370345 RepID=A0ABD0K9G9_9CAEN
MRVVEEKRYLRSGSKRHSKKSAGKVDWRVTELAQCGGLWCGRERKRIDFGTMPITRNECMGVFAATALQQNSDCGTRAPVMVRVS